MIDASGAETGGILRALRPLVNEIRPVVETKSPRARRPLRFAAEKNVTCEATFDPSEAARRRALAGREQFLAHHSEDCPVLDVGAPCRDTRAAKKAARATP